MVAKHLARDVSTSTSRRLTLLPESAPQLGLHGIQCITALLKRPRPKVKYPIQGSTLKWPEHIPRMLCHFCFNFANERFSSRDGKGASDDAIFESFDPSEPAESPGLPEVWRRTVFAHKSSQSFHDAVKDGCLCCRFHWQNIIGPVPNDPLSVPDDTLYPLIQIRCSAAFWTEDGGTLTLVFEPRNVVDASELRRFIPDLEGLSRAISWFDLTMGPKPFESRIFPDNCYPILVSRLRGWLCADGMKPSQDRSLEFSERVVSFRPTRLIELTREAGMVRLVHAADLTGTEAYAALSHRWPQSEFLKCREETIEFLKNDVPEHTLTKTFQEAIRLTRDLGFSYLWVDSLCIVQDDNEDWERESRTMASVYSNAEVTLAINTLDLDANVSFLGTVFQSFLKRTMAKGFPFTQIEQNPERLIALGCLASRGWCL